MRTAELIAGDAGRTVEQVVDLMKEAELREGAPYAAIMEGLVRALMGNAINLAFNNVAPENWPTARETLIRMIHDGFEECMHQLLGDCKGTG